MIECRHRQHAHVEDRIRDDKDTGLSKFPFKEFELNEVWLEIVMLAHDLIVWTQALALNGELAKAEPKRLRYRLLHVAGRLAFSGRRASSTSKTHGPGQPSSSPRFRNSRRSQPRPADTCKRTRHNQADPGHGRDHRCPQTGPTSSAATGTRPRRDHAPAKQDKSPLLTTKRGSREYLSRAYCTSRVKDLGIDHVDLHSRSTSKVPSLMCSRRSKSFRRESQRSLTSFIISFPRLAGWKTSTSGCSDVLGLT